VPFTRAHEDTKDVRRVYGVASTGNVDRQNTVVDQKSLKKAAERWVPHGKIFYNHEWHSLPSGRALSVDFEDNRMLLAAEVGHGYDVVSGFWGLAKIPVDDLWSAIKQGMVSAYSIAFNADPEEPEEEGGPTLLKVTELFETSFVSIPANAEAEFGVTRVLDDVFFMRALREPPRPGARDYDDYGLVLPAAAAAFGIEWNANSAHGIKVEGNRFALEEDPFDWSQVGEEVGKWRTSLQHPMQS
jgi:HK97 family phage prohead protease